MVVQHRGSKSPLFIGNFSKNMDFQCVTLKRHMGTMVIFAFSRRLLDFKSHSFIQNNIAINRLDSSFAGKEGVPSLDRLLRRQSLPLCKASRQALQGISLMRIGKGSVEISSSP